MNPTGSNPSNDFSSVLYDFLVNIASPNLVHHSKPIGNKSFGGTFQIGFLPFDRALGKILWLKS